MKLKKCIVAYLFQNLAAKFSSWFSRSTVEVLSAVSRAFFALSLLHRSSRSSCLSPCTSWLCSSHFAACQTCLAHHASEPLHLLFPQTVMLLTYISAKLFPFGFTRKRDDGPVMESYARYLLGSWVSFTAVHVHARIQVHVLLCIHTVYSNWRDVLGPFYIKCIYGILLNFIFS